MEEGTEPVVGMQMGSTFRMDSDYHRLADSVAWENCSAGIDAEALESGLALVGNMGKGLVELVVEELV